VLLASSSALLAAGGGAATSAAEPVVSDTARTAQSPGVRLQGVGSFQSPVFVTAPAGDSRRLFVVEREAASASGAPDALCGARSSMSRA